MQNLAKLFRLLIRITPNTHSAILFIFQDIDAAHINDPHMCVQYVNDIYAHLRESEDVKKPSTVYMETVQKDINATMRGILVDWLVEVAEEYKLSADTLFLSVLYIDRCLSVHTVARTQLQVKKQKKTLTGAA